MVAVVRYLGAEGAALGRVPIFESVRSKVFVFCSVAVIVFSFLWDGGPVDRVDRGGRLLPTDVNSQRGNASWLTDVRPRGELSHPILWRTDCAFAGLWCDWDTNTCTAAQMHACTLGASPFSAFCCGALRGDAGAYEEHVLPLEVGALLVFVLVCSLAADRSAAKRAPVLPYAVGFVFACALASLSFLVKAGVGRPRPSYYAQQYWALYSQLPGARDYEDDALKSFPSGHSTWVLCAAVYGTGVVWHVYDSSSALARVLSLKLVLFAVWVAVTRVEDYRHHPSDILAGGLWGAVASLTALEFVGPAVR